MNRWTLAVSLVLVSGFALGAQKAPAAKAPPKTDPAVAMEAAVWAAAKARDVKAFNDLMAEDCLNVYSSGFGTRNDETKDLKHYDMHSFKILESRVSHPTPDTTFVACKMFVSDTYKGKSHAGNLYSTSVWIKTKDGWKMKLHTQVRAN